MYDDYAEIYDLIYTFLNYKKTAKKVPNIIIFFILLPLPFTQLIFKLGYLKTC